MIGNGFYDAMSVSEFLALPLADICRAIPRAYSRTSRTSYLNTAACFDIETTSFTDGHGDKCACMYVWTLRIFSRTVMGRTWDDFIDVLDAISREGGLSVKSRMVIYVHNLSYEFQFMRRRFTWEKVFAIDTRKPVYALTTSGVEFRCSYLLSGYALDKLHTQLIHHESHKLSGYLDYSKPRHSGTPLTDDEIAYCVADVVTVADYIAERIAHDGSIAEIPLTKTGYVRKHVKAECLSSERYASMIKKLVISSDEYRQLKRAFQGGFTHANAFAVGKVHKDVGSYDFTSSYPAVMVSEKFPMSSAVNVGDISRDKFHDLIRSKCCLFDCRIEGLESMVLWDNPLSYSRCWNVMRPTINNGRLVRADALETTLTETDYLVLRRFYRWDALGVSNFRYYEKDYLPREYLEVILDLYHRKTSLKGVAGREYDYLKSKEMLNSLYGMCVTDICRTEHIYDGEWHDESPDLEESIDGYNHARRRALYYPWGVWVTAYARRNLFTGILSCGRDYIYSDTDSLKISNRKSHDGYFQKYNQKICAKIETALTARGIEPTRYIARTSNGAEKPMGVWDYEGSYSKFKTLGAKRYIYDDEKGFHITIAGVGKGAAEWLYDTYGDRVYDEFRNNLVIPANATGKNTHTYIDERRHGTLIDYLGNPGEYDELTAVHLEGCEYSLCLAYSFAKYVMSIRDDELL